jgi:hypothetical protein
VVAVPDYGPTTTPLANARLAREIFTVLSLLGLLALVAASDVAVVRPDVDHSDKRCGPLKLDVSDPCNAIAIAAGL